MNRSGFTWLGFVLVIFFLHRFIYIHKSRIKSTQVESHTHFERERERQKNVQSIILIHGTKSNTNNNTKIIIITMHTHTRTRRNDRRKNTTLPRNKQTENKKERESETSEKNTHTKSNPEHSDFQNKNQNNSRIITANLFAFLVAVVAVWLFVCVFFSRSIYSFYCFLRGFFLLLVINVCVREWRGNRINEKKAHTKNKLVSIDEYARDTSINSTRTHTLWITHKIERRK